MVPHGIDEVGGAEVRIPSEAASGGGDVVKALVADLVSGVF